jgi:hypothetical protein
MDTVLKLTATLCFVEKLVRGLYTKGIESRYHNIVFVYVLLTRLKSEHMINVVN